MTNSHKFLGYPVPRLSPLGNWIEINRTLLGSIDLLPDGEKSLERLKKFQVWFFLRSGEAAEKIEGVFGAFIRHGAIRINMWAFAHHEYYLTHKSDDYSKPQCTSLGCWMKYNPDVWRQVVEISKQMPATNPNELAQALAYWFKPQVLEASQKVDSFFGALILQQTSEIDWLAIANWIYSRDQEAIEKEEREMSFDAQSVLNTIPNYMLLPYTKAIQVLYKNVQDGDLRLTSTAYCPYFHWLQGQREK